MSAVQSQLELALETLQAVAAGEQVGAMVNVESDILAWYYIDENGA
jgi:hypothetical protein|tara:strand:+ start:360 stop:497 length:138 start_codon:yes stop_codon:yes gene_type:complete